MSNYFEYLDLPSLPDDMYNDMYQAVSRERPIAIHHYQYIQIYECPKRVEEYFRQFEFFKDPRFEFRIQMILNGFPVHIDHGREQYSYNYLIDTGGSTALTVWYEGTGWDVEFPKFNIIEGAHIEPRKWHKIDTSIYHNVINFWKPRLALTVARYDNSLSVPMKVTD